MIDSLAEPVGAMEFGDSPDAFGLIADVCKVAASIYIDELNEVSSIPPDSYATLEVGDFRSRDRYVITRDSLFVGREFAYPHIRCALQVLDQYGGVAGAEMIVASYADDASESWPSNVVESWDFPIEVSAPPDTTWVRPPSLNVAGAGSEVGVTFASRPNLLLGINHWVFGNDESAVNYDPDNFYFGLAGDVFDRWIITGDPFSVVDSITGSAG